MPWNKIELQQSRRLRVLLCVQAFPPLAKQAGGVSKHYLALVRALVEGLDGDVSVLTPVCLHAAGPEVDRWLALGAVRHIPVRAVRAFSRQGIATLLDAFNFQCLFAFLWECFFGDYDVCIIDDVTFRAILCLFARSFGLPTICTTHTDYPGMEAYRAYWAMQFAWLWHFVSFFTCTIHATVSTVFAKTLRRRYCAPVQAVWPPVLWSEAFRRDSLEFAAEAAKERGRWVSYFRFAPLCIFLYAGRWSSEKRIKLLIEAIPDRCALVIVGDGDTEYADEIEASRSRRVLPLRGMLDGRELRVAFEACDVVASASRFETLGNVIVEALAAARPVAVQPAQGHLEFVEDGMNSFLVDFDDAASAKARLATVVDHLSSGQDSAMRSELANRAKQLRSLDFATEVQRRLLIPATEASSKWRRRLRWLLLFEPLLRLIAFVVALVLWLSFWIGTRILYALSCDPLFRYLPPGTALETEWPSTLKAW